ncbi:integration host factor [Rhodococcus rhodnii LMG 5362]|uniref:Integration host factor n=2 Tax=Rhodococcus rhodnii TaxID=38312 RepID=R7WGW7_9NOCA|nr:integration host factor [Rhodococcus rhodnii LMG 5362]
MVYVSARGTVTAPAESDRKEVTMALPTLTPEQRAAALEKAAKARKARAELRESLKSGNQTLADTLAKADSDELVGKTKVLYVLESLPKVGKVKARSIIEELGIAESRRLGGLGARQRSELLAKLS